MIQIITDLFFEIIIPLIKIIAIVSFALIMVVVMVWLERRVLGFIQSRLGPNRVGFQGLLQPIADGVKLMMKENIMQKNADWLTFNFAPVIVFFSGLLAFAFIPFAEAVKIGDYTLTFWVAESPVGLLLVLCISTLSVFGIIFAGWSGNSKYPLLGGLRAVTQILSYEIPTVLSALAVIFFSQSMDMVDIVRAQKTSSIWYCFATPIAFFVFLISSFAETNRAPFDIPEAESELVAGFHTEYSGFKFALFFMAEYAHMVGGSCLLVVLFLGGWLRPFPNIEFLAFLDIIPGIVWFIGKTLVILYFFIWVRGTYPRYRLDGLIKLCWKWLVPLSILNILGIALYKVL